MLGWVRKLERMGVKLRSQMVDPCARPPHSSRQEIHTPHTCNNSPQYSAAPRSPPRHLSAARTDSVSASCAPKQSEVRQGEVHARTDSVSASCAPRIKSS